MRGIIHLVLVWLGLRLKSRRRLEAETLVLRHQLNVLRRKTSGRVRFSRLDRLVFIFLFRSCPSILEAAQILRPETVVCWHRQGFRALWRWKSRSSGGRPAISNEIRDLIREMSRDNWLWGAPRIYGELLKLGIEVAQSTVAKYMANRRRPSGQNWKTFLQNQALGISGMDLFVIPTISFKLLFCLVILSHGRRVLVHAAVTDHPTAEWIARQILEAYPWGDVPQYLLRDRDGVYGHAARRRLRALGIRDRPVAPRSPWQNGYVERLIGSIRRECLDHMIVLDANHLRGILGRYAAYYNRTRPHLSLDKASSLGRPVERVGRIVALPHLGGLHHQYARI